MSDEHTPDVTADVVDEATEPASPARGRRGRKGAGRPATADASASADARETPAGADADTLAGEPLVGDETVAAAAGSDGADDDVDAPAAAADSGGSLSTDDFQDSQLFDPAEVANAPRAPHPLKPVVEALIFASPEPLTIKAMARVLEDQPREDIEAALAEMRETYQRSDGLQLVEVAGGYQIVTRPELYEWVRRLFKERTTSKLSVQALETLAVIAYKQPVTSGEIAEIRGVSATTGVLNTLLDRKLVKIVGRKQVVGRPFMYGTTREFLDKFGLRDLSDLPKVEDMSEALGFDLPSPVDEGDGVSLPFDGPVEATLFEDGATAIAGDADGGTNPDPDPDTDTDPVPTEAAAGEPAADRPGAPADPSADADASDEDR
jgi:segregation and condensation protein B